jgi:hypothetical protein
MILVYLVENGQACVLNKKTHRPYKFLVYQNNSDKQVIIVALSRPCVHLEVHNAAMGAKIITNIDHDYLIIGAGVFEMDAYFLRDKSYIKNWSSVDF